MRTVQEIFNSMTTEQKFAVGYIVGEIVADKEDVLNYIMDSLKGVSV